MLTVGIHEGVKLGTEHAITQHGSLQVHFVQGNSDTHASLMDDDAQISEECKLFVPSIFLNDFNTQAPKKVGVLSKDIKKLRSYLSDILDKYMTKEKVNEYLSTPEILKGLGIDKDNMATELPKEGTLKAIYQKYSEGFILACKENSLHESDRELRIKFVRQSKDKHFPTFTKYTFVPWIEAMDMVSAEASKIEFTSQEIAKGLNDPTMVPFDNTTEEAANTADDLHEADNSIEETSFPPESIDEGLDT